MLLRERLAGCIPDAALAKVPRRFDVIGTVAIIALPPEIAIFGEPIASAIMEHHHAVRTVLNKVSLVTGDCRTARYEILAGVETITQYREYGFAYEFDLRSTFFNPRLATERYRVTRLVLSGERLLVPFCGAGPFVIPAAAQGARVHAIEKNPDACRWLARNIQRNHVERHVTVIQDDATKERSYPADPVDRAIIPAPFGLDSVFDLVAWHVRDGGTVHFYTFRINDEIPPLLALFRDKGFEPLFFRECGHVAPCVSRWVFDLKKCPGS